MHYFLETFQDYLNANAEMVRLMNMQLDEDSVEYRTRSLLKDRVLQYELENFPVLYPGSPYLKMAQDHKRELEEVLMISNLI